MWVYIGKKKMLQMKILKLLPIILSLSLSLSSFEKGVYVGPHFNYINVEFNNPSDLDGYAGGITTGGWINTCYFFGKINFEGTWNASRIVGDPCQTSSITEYFLNLELGKNFLWRCFCFHPYTGFGWDRFVNVQEPNTVALKYKYNKLFIPVGFYFRWNRCCDSFAFQFEFRPDVWSNLDLLSISLDPKWGYAFRAQVIYKRPIETCYGCFYFSWVPFFDWNRFGKVVETNSSETTLEIPALTRWDLGLRAILEYQF